MFLNPGRCYVCMLVSGSFNYPPPTQIIPKLRTSDQMEGYISPRFPLSEISGVPFPLLNSPTILGARNRYPLRLQKAQWLQGLKKLGLGKPTKLTSLLCGGKFFLVFWGGKKWLGKFPLYELMTGKVLFFFKI